VVIAFVWAAWAALFAGFALDVAPGAKIDDATQQLVDGAIALVLSVLAVRTWRIGVFTGARGVTVRGVLRTWNLPWADIAGFELGEWRGWGGFDCGVVRRADGSQVTVLALNPPLDLGKGSSARVVRVLDELNGELERARAAGVSVSRGEPAAAGLRPMDVGT
jgi:hypothetical protein